MPNIKSAMKRMRSDARKNARNGAAISELATLGKKLQQTLQSEPKKAPEIAAKLISRYDRAVSRGIVPRARADRKKSRITLSLAKVKK